MDSLGLLPKELANQGKAASIDNDAAVGSIGILASMDSDHNVSFIENWPSRHAYIR